MDEGFDMDILHKDEELTFPCKLLKFGFTYKIEVDLHGNKILFEPDEERKWRALIPYEGINSDKKIDKSLLTTVASTIDELLK